jgi:Nuclear RNA-splicing-associated protein
MMNSFKKKKSKKKHERKKRKVKRKRKRRDTSSDSSASSSSSSSSSSSPSDEKKKKHKSRKRKHKKEHKKERINVESKIETERIGESSLEQNDDDFGIPIHLMTMTKDKRGAPETKEDFDKRQSIVRRVVDEETGRSRLVKGDGEIIEEIVSREKHIQINKQTTKNDASCFEKKSLSMVKK